MFDSIPPVRPAGLATLVAVLLAGPAAHASDPLPPIATDRPGNGNAASTVPRGHVQIEASVNYARTAAGASDAQFIAFPTLVRYGLLDFAELRLGSSLVGIDATSGSNEDPAFTDTIAGVKLHALDGRGARPDVAVMCDVSLATGGGSFTNDTTVPDARVAAAWSLPANFGLLLNGGINLPRAGGDRFAQLLYVVNLGYAPAALLGGKLAVFAELFGQQPFDSAYAKVVQLDWGAAYALSRSLQLDFFAQHGLSDAATDVQLSVGVSTRL